MVLPDGLRALRRRLQSLGRAPQRGRCLRGSGRGAHPGETRPAAGGYRRRRTLPQDPQPRGKRERGSPGAPADAALAHEPRLAQGDFPGRQGPPRARRLHLADGGRALLPDVAGQGESSRRGRGGGARPVRPLHGGETTLQVPRARGPAGRLDRLAVLALLRVQRLEEQCLRRERPRGRLGEDLYLPLGVGVRRGTARVGGLRRARGDRRRPEAPVGRSGAGEGRRASRGVRLRRLARDPLFPGRVPDRARFSAAPRHLRGPEDLAALLVRDAAPVRRRGLQGEALRTVHHPLRGLRARGRVVGRTGAGQGVGPPAPHEPGAIVGLWVPRAMGTLHPGSLRGRGRPGGAYVQPRQDHQPRVVRPRGLGRPRQGADPGGRARGHNRAPGGDRRTPGFPPLELREKSSRLKTLGMDAEATRDQSHLTKLHENQTRRIEELSKEVDTLREQLSDDEVLAESLKYHAESLRGGERPPAHAHIMHATRPVSEAETHAGRVAQLWASISIALVLVTLILIIAYERSHLLSAPVFAIAVFTFIEAGFRRRLTRFIVSVNVALAVVGALVLLEQYFWSVIVLAVLGIGFYILWENLRELGR